MADPRPVVTEAERAAALALVQDWREHCGGDTRLTTGDQLVLVGMVAAAQADAREGATIPGARQVVEQTTRVRLRVFGSAAERDRELERLRPRLRAAWATALESSGMRPLGWPPVTTTWLRWPWDYAGGQQEPQECDEAAADVVCLTIRGTAVAL